MLDPILYAEDDENDVFLMKRAFRKLGIANPIHFACDGKEAVDYLAGIGAFQDRVEHPLPCLVLLDLSMPGKHGLEVLKWIRSTPALTGLPVVVLSSSNQESDVHRAYLLGANGFLMKPGDPDELLKIMRRVQSYWLADERPVGTFVDFAAEECVPPPRDR
ncbi:MAG: response regulator [Myxococcota bacterium]